MFPDFVCLSSIGNQCSDQRSCIANDLYGAWHMARASTTDGVSRVLHALQTADVVSRDAIQNWVAVVHFVAYDRTHNDIGCLFVDKRADVTKCLCMEIVRTDHSRNVIIWLTVECHTENLLTNGALAHCRLRSAAGRQLIVPWNFTDFEKRALAYTGPSAWNSLPTELRMSSTTSPFCAGLQICLLRHWHLRNSFGIWCWYCINNISHIVVRRPCSVLRPCGTI